MTDSSGTTSLIARRYELGEVLGSGTSAVVYRAWDRLGERHVALKLFNNSLSEKDLRRRQRESQVLAGLRHPRLVEFELAGTDLMRDYLVMTLVEGPSLAECLKGTPLSPEGVARLGSGVAEGLAHIHQHGIIHRDLKPANILIAADGPRLVDFGLAHHVGSLGLTSDGNVVGTAAYMAPEQVRGDDVGPAADVYALGLILLECLTGYRQYPGSATESALARLHRVPAVPGALPADLRTLLIGMTAMEPGQRPSAAEVAFALDLTPAQASDWFHRAAVPQATVSKTAVSQNAAAVQHPATTRPLTPSPLSRRRRPKALLRGLAVGIPSAAAAVATVLTISFPGSVPQDTPITGHSPVAPPPASNPATPVPPVTPAAAPNDTATLLPQPPSENSAVGPRGERKKVDTEKVHKNADQKPPKSNRGNNK